MLQTSDAPTHPFRRTLPASGGRFDVTVTGRNSASIQSGPDFVVAGTRASFAGRMRRSDGVWRLADFRAVTNTGRTLEAVVGAEALAGLVSVVEAASSDHLEGNERMLLEADLVGVFRARKERQDCIEEVRREIARRKAKLRDLERSFAKEAQGLDAKEARIRSELASLEPSNLRP